LSIPFPIRLSSLARVLLATVLCAVATPLSVARADTSTADSTETSSVSVVRQDTTRKVRLCYRRSGRVGSGTVYIAQSANLTCRTGDAGLTLRVLAGAPADT
jgi:hypothetical protein